MSEISETLSKQRIRNRLIESLDAFADVSTVSVLGTNEIIETWYDYMDDGDMTFFEAPVFTSEEVNAIKRFHNLLEATHRMIPCTWELEDLSECKEWGALVRAAQEEHSVFLERGLSNEEREIT